MFIWLCLNVIGQLLLVYVLADTLWAVLQLVRAYMLPFFQPHEQQSLTTRFGSWAVITGSTDGIGRAYAFELASRNVNICLIARNMEKLIVTANEIEAKHGVKTKIISADFSKGAGIYDHISNELKDITVGILVNNVGTQYAYPMYLSEVPEQTLWDLINVNVGATTMMTRMILPLMKDQGRGAIVNVSSGSELQPLPLMTVYAATKAFIKSFTQAISYEYTPKGIFVQNLAPLFVNTKMNAFSWRLQENSLFVPDAATYARHAVNTLGKVDHTTGYWPHGFQYFFASLAPIRIRTYIGGSLNKGFRKDYFDGKVKP